MQKFASWLHHLKSGSTSNPLHATPSGIMKENFKIKATIIIVNVKATTEFTTTMKVGVSYNDERNVKDLVKDALEIEEDPTNLAKVTRQSNNAEIEINDLNTKLNTFPGGTVLDISK